MNEKLEDGDKPSPLLNIICALTAILFVVHPLFLLAFQRYPWVHKLYATPKEQDESPSDIFS